MKLVSKIFAGVMLAFLGFCAFAQAPSAATSAAPATAAADPDPAPQAAAEASVCKNQKGDPILSGGQPRTYAGEARQDSWNLLACGGHPTTFYATSKYAQFNCTDKNGFATGRTYKAAAARADSHLYAACGGSSAGVGAGSKSAHDPAAGSGREVVLALASQLAQAEAVKQCPRYIYYVNGLPKAGPCKVEGDVVTSVSIVEPQPQPAPAPVVAAPAAPVVFHNLGTVHATGATPAPQATAVGGASPVGFQAYCEAKFNNGIVREYVTAVDATDQSIRSACDNWAKAQATARGVNRDAPRQANGGAALFGKP